MSESGIPDDAWLIIPGTPITMNEDKDNEV